MLTIMKPIARYLEDAGTSVGQLAADAGLDAKLVKAIVSGNYTPSPVAAPAPGRRPGGVNGRDLLGARGSGGTPARQRAAIRTLNVTSRSGT